MDETQASTRVLKNGAVQDTRTGRIVKAPSMPEHSPAELARIRWSKAKAAARAGILAAAQQAGAVPAAAYSVDAWKVIVQARAAVALADPGRAGTDAAEFVGRAAGYYGEQEKTQADNAGAVSISVHVDDLRRIAEALRAETARRVVDVPGVASVVDVPGVASVDDDASDDGTPAPAPATTT